MVKIINRGRKPGYASRNDLTGLVSPETHYKANKLGNKLLKSMFQVPN